MGTDPSDIAERLAAIAEELADLAIDHLREATAAVRAGNVIAFGVERLSGREGIVVVAEAREDAPDAVREAVAGRVRDAVGLPSEVVLVAPGSLPKTSSGKLQRSLCRSRYLDSDLELV